MSLPPSNTHEEITGLGYDRIPIIKLWRLLLVPLQGEITDGMASQLCEEVLDRIHAEGCSGLVIDITGLWLVDSHLCSVLAELSSAARVMGVRTVLSGMKPDIALTLETMGLAIRNVETTLDLEKAVHLLGIRFLDEDPEQPHERDSRPADGKRRTRR